MSEEKQKNEGASAPSVAPNKEIKTVQKLTEAEELTIENQRLELEIKRKELATKNLEILEKEANLQDIQERLAERQGKRQDKSEKAKSNGLTLAQNRAALKAVQDRCNHKKGGNGENGIVGGQGDDSQYAVLKHIFLNGDMWVRCLRCRKLWKPPIKKNFTTETSYQAAWDVYNAARNFQTRNGTSSGYQFRFSDGGEYFREVTEHVNLN
jgi:hypothetical protein